MREQENGKAEEKRLSVLEQCDKQSGCCRKDMKGYKINEALHAMVATKDLEDLPVKYGEGGRRCRTTAKGKECLKAGRTSLADPRFVRNEENTFTSRNAGIVLTPNNLTEVLNAAAKPNIRKAKAKKATRTPEAKSKEQDAQNKKRKLAAPYDFDGWFDALNAKPDQVILLTRGKDKDFPCRANSMAVQLRMAAATYGIKISISIEDDNHLVLRKRQAFGSE